MVNQVIHFIRFLFDTEKGQTKDPVAYRNELNAMKNNQPPDQPTFVFNQNEVKDFIKTKLTDSINYKQFSNVLLSGYFGYGKTHFLNYIFANLKKHDDFFVIKFRVEDTSRFKYDFVKAVSAHLFSMYTEKFRQSLTSKVKEVISQPLDFEKELNEICDRLGVSHELGSVLWNLLIPDNTASAVRMLGASYGKTEARKLQVDSLTTKDYTDVIRLFLEMNTERLTVVMLDEFEHAQISLNAAQKKSFLINSYKYFLDKAANFKNITLITAVTEQFDNELEQDEIITKKLTEADYALWDRIKHARVRLHPFQLSSESLNELLQELVPRYNQAYEDVVRDSHYLRISKEIAKKFEGKAQSYRDVVVTILKIMDEVRLTGNIVGTVKREIIKEKEPKKVAKEKDNGQIDLFTLVETIPIEEHDEYMKYITEIKHDWEKVNKLKPFKIKTAMEIALKKLGYNIVPADGALSIAVHEKSNKQLMFYMAYVKGLKNLSKKLDDYKRIIDKRRQEMPDATLEAYFLYAKSEVNEVFLKKLYDCGIFGIGMENDELFALLGLRLETTLKPSENIKNKRESLISEVLNKFNL